jgi:hypothetical protein
VFLVPQAWGRGSTAPRSPPHDLELKGKEVFFNLGSSAVRECLLKIMSCNMSESRHRPKQSGRGETRRPQRPQSSPLSCESHTVAGINAKMQLVAIGN